MTEALPRMEWVSCVDLDVIAKRSNAVRVVVA
jgi:hypothetical protein